MFVLERFQVEGIKPSKTDPSWKLSNHQQLGYTAAAVALMKYSEENALEVL